MTTNLQEKIKPWRGKRSTLTFGKPWGAIALFLAPVMLYYAVFILYPVVMSFVYSFYTIEPVAGQVVSTFVGFKNFIDLFSDEIFLQGVKNTIIWATVGPALEMLLATSLAFVVYFRAPLWRQYRIAWFTPYLVSGVIVGLVFRWIFNYEWGLINEALRMVGLGDWALNWLGRRDTALGVVIFVHLWATFGYSFILLLAGLSSTSEEVIEAAYIDGASKLKVCWYVLLPLLRPTLVTVLVLSFIGKMRAFHVPWVLTGGGPMHASETVATWVQRRAFGWNTLDLGYPAAMAVAWFGVVAVGVALINRWMKSRSDLY